jgi:hypothetical protein
VAERDLEIEVMKEIAAKNGWCAGPRNVDQDKLRAALILLAEREAKRLVDFTKTLRDEG